MGLKQSRYNLFFDGEGGAKLAFNSMTAALAEIEPDKWPIIQAFLENPNREPENETERDLLENLKYGGFLIDENFDEIAYLKVMNRMIRFSKESLGLTICPTLNCNFACFYCYETHPKGVMSQEVQDRLVEFAKERLEGAKSFQVTWYGGEPLLAFDVIENLSEKFIGHCEEKGITYSAYLVTNGYLLTPEKAKRLSELRVQGAQITLDGPPDVHDKRRVLTNGGPTFWRIMENLKSALNFIDKITVRVNVDKENKDRALELLDVLEGEGLSKKVWVHFVKTGDYNPLCADVSGVCLSHTEYEELALDVDRKAFEKGYEFWNQPRPKGATCTSIALNAYGIMPDGKVHKCWLEVYDASKAVGSLENLSLLSPNLLKWLSWDPFEIAECRDCKVLPLCLGGCPYISMQKGNVPGLCEWSEKHLHKTLGQFYNCRGMVKKKEESLKTKGGVL